MWTPEQLGMYEPNWAMAFQAENSPFATQGGEFKRDWIPFQCPDCSWEGDPDIEDFGDGDSYPLNRNLRTVTCPECGWEQTRGG